MSHNNEEAQSPYEPTNTIDNASHGQQYKYPPPNHTTNFYPPQYPSTHYHQQHGTFSHYDGYYGGGSLPALQSTTDFSNNSPGRYTTSVPPNYYGRSQVMPPSNTWKSFNPPPTLPAVAEAAPAPSLTASPNKNNHNRQVNTIYQQSPYFSEAPGIGTRSSGSSESSSASTTARPIPARSAFMCFSEARGNEIAAKGAGSKGGFVEAVAAEWRNISKQEKAYWESVAKKEKSRFNKEKEALCRAHKGPVARKLRAKKNPLAPKRNMSAFLMWAQHNRRPLQKENPDMSNADISRLLGEVWRNTSVEEKRPFLEREEVERKIYKAKMEAWKNDEKFRKSMAKSNAGMDYLRGPDQRQDVASFTREETHSRYDLADHGQEKNNVEPGDAAPRYYDYVYNPTQAQMDSAYATTYSYPRPL